MYHFLLQISTKTGANMALYLHFGSRLSGAKNTVKRLVL